MLRTPGFSPAELSAMRLDGVARPLGDGVLPHDVPDGPAERTASIEALADPRLIAERRTAAWIHGALAEPPHPHTLAVATADRVRVATLPPMGARVRQVRLTEQDVVSFGGTRVTRPLRTLVDLARTDETVHDATLIALANADGVSIAAAVEHVRGLSHLPNKRIALARLARVRPR